MKANEASKQYISKSVLVAEIEKHLKYATNGIEYAQMGIDKGLEHYKEELAIWQHCQSMCHHILSFIDTLEVKEVDLEKAIDDYIYTNNGRKRMALELDWKQCDITFKAGKLIIFAKHFFELGLKVAQKGEEV